MVVAAAAAAVVVVVVVVVVVAVLCLPGADATQAELVRRSRVVLEAAAAVGSHGLQEETVVEEAGGNCFALVGPVSEAAAHVASPFHPLAHPLSFVQEGQEEEEEHNSSMEVEGARLGGSSSKVGATSSTDPSRTPSQE